MNDDPRDPHHSPENSSSASGSHRKLTATADPTDRYPDIGYHLVTWEPPYLLSDGMTPLEHTQTLTLSAILPRLHRARSGFTVEGSGGHTYTQTDFDAIPDDPDPRDCAAVCERIERTTGKSRRIALVRLTRIADTHPKEAATAVETLVTVLADTPPAVQGEALGCLQSIAAADTDVVSPAVAPAIQLLTEAASRLLRDACLRFFLDVADANPEPLVEVVPELGELLIADAADPAIVSRVIDQISLADSDALMPIVSKLELFLEQGSNRGRVGVIAALGRLTKRHPTMTKEIIPTARELMHDDDIYVASNAAGLLADLAAEYPTAVVPEIDPFVQFLDHTDPELRYNVVAVLTRVAEVNPGAVEPLTAEFIALLDDKVADTRSNVCWALRYIDATAAVDRLIEVAETDPDETVQSVALHALNGISE